MNLFAPRFLGMSSTKPLLITSSSDFLERHVNTTETIVVKFWALTSRAFKRVNLLSHLMDLQVNQHSLTVHCVRPHDLHVRGVDGTEFVIARELLTD